MGRRTVEYRQYTPPPCAPDCPVSLLRALRSIFCLHYCTCQTPLQPSYSYQVRRSLAQAKNFSRNLGIRDRFLGSHRSACNDEQRKLMFAYIN